ncbi:MAG: hypothetical protein AB1393_13780 [Candidatus Edwardsbacteria bacterium]
MANKFNPGQIVVTQGVAKRMQEDQDFRRFVDSSFKRHLAGDWGDLSQEDKQENEFSLKEGFRILSSYENSNTKIWIITEADRSVTTILFPEEY